jgi:hypothetical protein
MAKMKGCKFCDKKGLRFLPLVYGVVTGTDKDALGKLPGIKTKKLGLGVTDLVLGGEAKYAIRLVPPGYLYNLIERNGIKYWQSYLVLEDSFLYQMTNSEPPQVKPEFNCDRSVCGIDASMIDIPNAQEVQNSWLLYSPSAMTPAKLEEYKNNAEAYSDLGKIRHFSPAAWLAGKTEQTHTLLASEVLTTVAEYILFTQPGNPRGTPLGNLLEQQMIPAIDDAYAGTPPDAKGLYSARLGSLFNTMKRDGYGAVVAFDHIGITQALNDFRNAPLEGLQGYLAATDEYGASNLRRMQISEAIEEIRIALENGVVQSASQFNEQHQIGSDQYFRHQRSVARQLREMGRINDAEAVEAEAENGLKAREVAYQRAIEEAKAEGPTKWKKKYATRLDSDELDRFQKMLQKRTEEAFAVADRRAKDHMKWFESDRLVLAFDVYDPNSNLSGYSFALQAAICTIGMAGCKANDARLDEWIKSPSIERGNLYMRGFVFNNADLIKSAKQEFADIQAASGEVMVASAITAARMQKATKGLVSGFKAIDSAFDEWVRNQGKEEFSRHWVQSTGAGKLFGKASGSTALQTYGVEILLYHKVSEITRTIFRTSMGGKLDKKLTAHLAGFLYSRLGNLTEKLAFDELMLKVPEHKLAEGHKGRSAERNTELAERNVERKAAKVAGQVDESLEVLVADARAKVEAKVRPTLKELAGNKNPPTNNYHQVRIGVLLGCIEMIGLAEKLGHAERNTKTYLEIGGSVAAIGGIVLDTYYSAAKSIREIQPYKAISAIEKSADIVRGKLKLGAGVLGAGAGFASAYLDYMKFGDEKNPTLKLIYGIRSLTGTVSAGMTLVVAYSYTGPWLRSVATGYAETTLRRRALLTLAEGAVELAARVRLLVWVARFNWIGLGLTAGEIGYLLFKDDDLQNWLEESTFRKEKKHKNWLGSVVINDYHTEVHKELEELDKATQTVGIGR